MNLTIFSKTETVGKDCIQVQYRCGPNPNPKHWNTRYYPTRERQMRQSVVVHEHFGDANCPGIANFIVCQVWGGDNNNKLQLVDTSQKKA